MPEDRRIPKVGEPREQPAKPAPAEVRAATWYPPAWELADATAIKALYAGTASGEEQKRAIEWILKGACAMQDWPYRPGASDRDTNIGLGRQFVGHQIAKLINVDLAQVRRRDPRADPHEPKG